MATWQNVWREGIVPQLSAQGLRALQKALNRNDNRLLQGRTVTPPPLAGLEEAEVEGCCAVGWAGWQGQGCQTVGELERFFERVCSAADDALGEPGACRHFLDWFDRTPRPVMRKALLAEIELALHGEAVAA